MQVNTLQDHVNTLTDHILDTPAPRLLVAVSGAPGSGKSTLAEALSTRLNLKKRKACVVPMDGFHLTNDLLEKRGLQHRKGAPETFDAKGFIRLVTALKTPEEVFAPVFDRSRDLAVAGAISVPGDTEVVIVEGNYLMFDEDPWRALAPLWDLTVWLDVPMTELRARLLKRWLGLNHSSAVATRRAEGNDIPNAQRVVDRALPCDFSFGSR